MRDVSGPGIKMDNTKQGCAAHRETQILLGMKKRLMEEKLTEVVRRELEKEVERIELELDLT